jgi:HAE1 family hydrophobic/amphiphilic exporter-1
MFMISAVVTLLGIISLSRLPVDLMPEFEQPTLNVRTSYAGVGPLEIEELITRPMEQAVSAVPGITRVESSSSEGNSQIRLNFEWGSDLSEAADEVRTRVDRMRNRLPEDADPPTIFKFDSNQLPVLQIGIEGDYDPVTLREVAQNEIAPRFERVDGVAAVTVNGGVRREIHVDLSKEKITALNLSVSQVVNALRSENQNTPLGEIYQGDSTFLVRSQGQFQSIEDIKDMVVMTRQAVPVYLRDIAEVSDTTEQRRSFMRINGKPGIQLQVQKQSGKNTVAVARAVRVEVDRVNKEVPGVRMIVTQDNSVFIQRAIDNVQEHALVGGILVVLIIFAFLRDVRSTLIVCTSIPVSVIGTFALLYFGGFTLNTMTFGGLALGIGMIVDAAIVVLENTHRHLHMGKDKMTAAIEGSEEVWSAILASTLTHIAVFIPLLFLSGTASIMFTQLSVVVMFSLAMSLFVAVTIVPVLCSRWLKTPDEEAKDTGIMASFYRLSERFLETMDEQYRRAIHVALNHRPTVIATAAVLVIAAAIIYPMITVELMPQTDEGEVNINAELAVGTRVERTEEALLRLEDMVRERVPEAVTIITNGGGGGNNWNGGGGGGGGGSTHRGQIRVMLVPRGQRMRTNEQIAIALRRELQGLPGVAVRANPAGGNNQIMRFLSGGGNNNQGGSSRLQVEIRGHDLDDARRVAQDVRKVMEDTPGVADVQVGREEGRPEIAVRVDRPKAAMLGMSVGSVATTIQTNVAGTAAAQFRERGNEYPVVVRLREADRQEISDVGDVLLSTPTGQVVPAKNVLAVNREAGPVQIDRKNMERMTRVNAETEIPISEAVKAVQDRITQVRVPP